MLLLLKLLLLMLSGWLMVLVCCATYAQCLCLLLGCVEIGVVHIAGCGRSAYWGVPIQCQISPCDGEQSKMTCSISCIDVFFIR